MQIISSGSTEGPAGGAVEASQTLAQFRTVDNAINAPQEVIGGDVILKAELIGWALLHRRALAHHGPILR